MQRLTPLSLAIQPPSETLLVRLEPRRVLPWVYVARFSLSTAIFVAALLAWAQAPRANTVIATLIFAGVLVVTGASVLYTEVYRRPVSVTLLYGQMVFDVIVVTMVVHLTWDGNSSLFAPVYILIIAVAALLLPVRGVSMVAGLVILLYSFEIAAVQRIDFGLGVGLQLLVFGSVALGSGYIAARLREAGVGRDMLAQELARFRLRQADVQRLHRRAERLAAVAELGASMAHEIRNPLASIRSAVEQLADSPRSTEEDRTLSELVQRESDRLTRLLSKFLDFARADTPVLREFDILRAVRHAAEILRQHPDYPSGLRVEYHFSHSSLKIVGDEDMLHRAFLNLLLNAMQASSADGLIRIEATVLLPRQLEEHASAFRRGAVAVRIIDQGSGVAESIREKLFHPFFTTKPNGSGLGLAIVHRSIEFHKGVVHVDSSSVGASFTILLPQT